MASSFTSKLNLEKPADKDKSWGTAYRGSMDELESRLTLQYTGTPQGNVAGAWVGQTCLDTSNNIMYTCTTAGIAAAAIWSVLELNAALNLSDLASASVSRTNLGLGTMAVVSSGTSAGNGVLLTSSAALPAVDGSLLTNLAKGKIKQVVYVEKTDTWSDNSNSFAGVTGLSASITPSAASSKVLLLANVMVSRAGIGGLRLVQGANVISEGDAAGSRQQVGAQFDVPTDSQAGAQTVMLMGAHSPATTSSTTYGVEALAPVSGSIYVNRSWTDTDSVNYLRGSSWLFLLELGA